MVNVILAGLSRAILPPVCVLCAGPGQPDLDLCAACELDLPTNRGACSRCGEQLGSAEPMRGLECGACLRKPPKFDATHCAFRYGYPVDHLIRALKYHGRVAYARVTGELLARSLLALARPLPQALVPVPLAHRRFRERGFNQAHEVAVTVARRLNIALCPDVLVRTRSTREQAGLERVARRRNVRGAFTVRAPLPSGHIALLDDVVTTGSTVNEVARILKRAGAERVDVWAVARASR